MKRIIKKSKFDPNSRRTVFGLTYQQSVLDKMHCLFDNAQATRHWFLTIDPCLSDTLCAMNNRSFQCTRLKNSMDQISSIASDGLTKIGSSCLECGTHMLESCLMWAQNGAIIEDLVGQT